MPDRKRVMRDGDMGYAIFGNGISLFHIWHIPCMVIGYAMRVYGGCNMGGLYIRVRATVRASDGGCIRRNYLIVRNMGGVVKASSFARCNARIHVETWRAASLPETRITTSIPEPKLFSAHNRLVYEANLHITVYGFICLYPAETYFIEQDRR